MRRLRDAVAVVAAVATEPTMRESAQDRVQGREPTGSGGKEWARAQSVPRFITTEQQGGEATRRK